MGFLSGVVLSGISLSLRSMLCAVDLLLLKEIDIAKTSGVKGYPAGVTHNDKTYLRIPLARCAQVSWKN